MVCHEGHQAKSMPQPERQVTVGDGLAGISLLGFTNVRGCWEAF